MVHRAYQSRKRSDEIHISEALVFLLMPKVDRTIVVHHVLLLLEVDLLFILFSSCHTDRIINKANDTK